VLTCLVLLCPILSSLLPQVLFEQSKQLAEGSVLSWGNRARSSGPDLSRSSRAKTNGRSAAPPAPAAGSSEGLEKQAKQKWAEAERLSKQAARQVLQEAQVVCATCSGAGDPLLNDL
jgi:superfamily I DNA and/or RNA helicase